MKKLIGTLIIAIISFASYAQKPAKSLKIVNQTVEVACGECQFKMKGKDCELAIRIDGKSYFVDGKGIDDFGDAHGKHGFCNAISKAEVTGEIVDNRFKATTIKLLTEKKKG